MARETILIIDDEADFLLLLSMNLQHAGFKVLTAGDGETGLEIFQKEMPHLVICDLRLPKMDGLGVLKKIREIEPDTPVIMLTAHGSSDSVKEAMRLGAFSHITKPYSTQELHLIVAKALEARALKKEVLWLRDETLRKIDEDLIGETPQMRGLMAVITKVSESDAPTILLQGESGTGKNFLARLIHLKSKRAHAPFTEINCASLPETLIESELFGYTKGAFTDAKSLKPGLFEVARGGTLFLDEIGEMSIATQAKLLQAIEGRKFRRLGGLEDIEIDVRIIAAASINLQEAVRQKRFREDLYFRLQLIPIFIPPLRERPEDIPLLILHFTRQFNLMYHKKIEDVSPEAMVLLKSYSWPGNVRELKNVIERLAILDDSPVIEASELPLDIRSGGDLKSADFQIPEQGINLEGVERQFIVQALQKTSGNQSRAAQLLGITRHTLRYRMEKFGLM